MSFVGFFDNAGIAKLHQIISHFKNFKDQHLPPFGGLYGLGTYNLDRISHSKCPKYQKYMYVKFNFRIEEKQA